MKRLPFSCLAAIATLISSVPASAADGYYFRTAKTGAIGRGGASPAQAAISFPTVTDAPLGAAVRSAIQPVTGLASTVTATVSGDLSPIFRVCADVACATQKSGFGASATVSNGDYVQLAVQTSISDGGTLTANFSAGTAAASWTVVKLAKGPVMQFAAASGAAGSVVMSEIRQNTSYGNSVFQVSGTGTPEARTCADAACASPTAWGTTVSIALNRYIQVRATAPTSGTTTVSTSIAGRASTWTVAAN